MFDVVITPEADADIQAAYEWWRDNRSAEQALRWYEAIYPAIDTLRTMPTRCPPARERDAHPGDLRQLSFSLGRRPTHRIVFVIEERTVTIVRVRHTSQRDLRPDEF
jgi:plasmid stabilization system protein ParE